MVIRFTKTTRFLVICVLLLVTALISIGTKSMSVSAPYAASGALPVVIYRDVGAEGPTSPSLQELEADLAYLQAHYNALSEQDIVYTLRRGKALTETPVLLVFDDAPERFGADILPLLEERDIPWFSASKSTVLVSELRTAGFAVTQLERTGGVALRDQLGAMKS